MQQKFISKFLVLTLLLAIAFTSNLCAQVIYVNIAATGLNNGTSWTNAYTDFQAGVNAAASGQSVWVAKGTYQPYNDGDYYSMKSGVAIYGGFAGGETALTARNFLTNITTLKGNDMSVIYNNGINSSAVLDGFTITGGIHTAGGGMYNNNSSPTINNVIFIKNVATTAGLGSAGFGGGMYNGQSSPIITNVQFIQNTADDVAGGGGGIYNANTSSPRITNTQFTQNSANGYGGQGGGMFNNGNSSSPIISNTQFTQNTANGTNGKGGGMYTAGSLSLSISNVQFTQNTATGAGGEGGGMFNFSGYTSSIISNVKFIANTANLKGGGFCDSTGGLTCNNITFYKDSVTSINGVGGGMVEWGTYSIINNAVFLDNYSGSEGGGIYISTGCADRVDNATFLGNLAVVKGNSIFNGGSAGFYSCLIWGNGAGTDPYNNATGIPTYTYAYCYAPITLAGNHSVISTTDPFLNSANPLGADGILGTSDDGLQIATSSAAFNAGINSANTNATDIAGNSRIKYVTIDMGAYENQGPAVIRWYVDSASTAGIKNGMNWANAFTTFQQATAIASSGDSIWVAKGTYQPLVNTSYKINNNVAIYGGFAENESSLTARNWVTNHSILKGNNSGVIIDSGLNKNATFDGLTITNGKGSRGPGIYNLNSSPFITNCTFSSNVGSSQGGAIYQDGGTLNITHNIFLQNKATGGGAVRANTVSGGSDPNVVIIDNIFYNNTSTFDDGSALSLVMGTGTDTVINNVFAQNISNTSGGNNDNGGAIVQENGSSSYITNNTFYADTATSNSGAIRFKSGGNNRYLYNNLFYKNFNGTDNTDVSLAAGTTITAQSNNELSTINPMFANEANLQGADGFWFTTDDGLQLLRCSPAINIGSNTANKVTEDITAQQRIFNSTIDLGAYEYQSLPDGSSLALNKDTTNQTIYPGTEALITTGACRVIAKVLPDGSNPLAGSVRTEAYIDPSVQTYTNIPYVQRHFDITPSTGAATATAKVTLFVLQSEFDALNAFSNVKLPTGPGDAAGIANLNVIQFHGISATGTPGTYSGGTAVIDPNDADIVWNNTLNRWEISFDVTGFSGFIIVPVGGVPLSLNLLSFTGQLVNGKTQLQWQTANEINTSYFKIEKSIDGTHFDSLTTTKAAGSGDNSYSTVDEQTQIGDNYYRLKSVNNDGTFIYSNIVLINKSSSLQINSLLVYPNPSSNQITVSYDNTENAIINVISLDGQKVLTTSSNGQTKTIININQLASGTYFIEYNNNGETLRDKFVKVR
jgi:predicted outer membrane repeat protein